MSSYLRQGFFPLKEGYTHDGNVLLSFGIWEVPEASNDEAKNDPEWHDTEPEVE